MVDSNKKPETPADAAVADAAHRTVVVLDQLIPWAVRGVVEHPDHSSIGSRCIDRAMAMRAILTGGDQEEVPPMAELEQTETDALRQELEPLREWSREMTALARQLLDCRSAGQEDTDLYFRLARLVGREEPF